LEGEKASCLALTCRTKSTCTVEPPLLPCENKGFSDPYTTKITPAYHPASSTSRATLSSKVTEPFCRLPLHTFCPKLEAINLEHLLRFVERLDWKLTLSLQFSWRTKKAGRRKKAFLLFKRNEKDQRIILINNSFRPACELRFTKAQPALFTFLNRKDISAAASFSWLEVLLRCRKQIPKDARGCPRTPNPAPEF